jgi:membrane-associated phospholipid phosphatase
VALGAWFWSQALIGGRGFPEDRIGDLVHDLTASWNRSLNEHPRRANALLMSSSLLLDVLGVFLLAAGIFGSTLRPFVGLLILFIFRQLCQGCCSLPAPQGLIWRNPGFPSLLVTYGVANDLFISGHSAMAVLGAIEVWRICPLWLGIAAAVVAVYEIGVVLVLRAHYTMDVLAAVAAAWCAADFAARLCATLQL